MEGLDKVRATLLGRPLIRWTLDAIADARLVERIVLVGDPDRLAAIGASTATKVVATVEGGGRRQDSVACGFRALEEVAALADDDVVLVHDGARPLVTSSLVDAVALAVVEHGAAIPVVPVAETLKRVDGDRLGTTVDRAGLVAAQTPQGARAGILRRAWATFPADVDREFTDEAALLEACTIPVHPIPGDVVNLKVTLPADLSRAEAYLAAGGLRTGFGMDTHPFGPQRPLRLGGVVIDDAPGLHGHSDGDVALHAVADALLGAAGLGDLGRLFPADARTDRGISSTLLLETVVGRVRDAGWRPTAVDLTIVGARPRLGARLDAMRDAISDLLELARDAVSIKASTGNLNGAEGAGRAISASAVATVVRSGEVRSR